MCGINGLVSTEYIDASSISVQLSKMNCQIIHRGPDQDGFFVESNNRYSVGMAMRRLSIIDLSTGEQPMASEDKKIHLVYNGEIYNFLKLKEELVKKGHVFKTTSDTEVILRLYEEYDTDAFALLDGMFAFSIFDKRKNKIIIARDFFGEKPLYYIQDGKSFYWASELKSILENSRETPSISLEGLNLFFQLTYIPAPFTIYENVYKLEANHYLEFECTTAELEITEIRQNFSEEIRRDISFDEAKKETYERVQQSVESRSISDVPLGAFLSGGVDSSIVSLCMAQQSGKQIDTFSIGFEKKSFDESDKARTVANLISSNHHEFIVSEKDLRDHLDQILLNFDEPFADSSSLPTYFVASKTQQHVKVALTGDGGDEIFGGYNKYYIGKMNKNYTSIFPKRLHASLQKMILPALTTKDDNRGLRFKAKKVINAVNYEGDFYYKMISLGFQEEELADLLKGDFYQKDPLEYFKNKIGKENRSLTDFRNIDKIISLEGDMLVKVDRTSMLTSLESRAPFLNKDLWNFTAQLPEDFLMKGWNKKYLLKEAFRHYFPKGFLDKSKQGFGVPVGDWLREYLSKELRSYLEPEFLKAQNIFNLEEISSIVEKHLSGKQDNTFKVWTFYCFQKWYKNNFKIN